MLYKQRKSKIDAWEEVWGKNWATQHAKEYAHMHLSYHFTASNPHDPKHSLFSPTATVSCVSKKTAYLFL